MQTHGIFYLEDDVDLASVIKVTIERILKQPVVLASSFDEMVKAQRKVLQCQSAILDIDLGRGCLSGIDAFYWLRANGFTGAIVFLTGHGRSHPLVAHAMNLGNCVVLSKPIEPSELFKFLNKENAASETA